MLGMTWEMVAVERIGQGSMLHFPGPTNAVRGRYAPSPTGRLHVGSARTALAAWLSARAQGGTFIMRVEDLDGPRTVPGMAEAILEDLAWLGLDWDEGPARGGPHAPYIQSERHLFYEAALERLHDLGRLFPCRRSRKDLLRLATAPHGSDGLPPYPGALRPRTLAPGWFEAHRNGASDAALRFGVHDPPVTFEDRVYGVLNEPVRETVGDFVLKRRDGVYAYQLAVVVDDLMMGVNEVVRGEDLLASTARQIQLIEALGGARPVYAHVPLVAGAEGQKLSKRDRSLTIQALREAGVLAEALVGYLGYSLGLLPEPVPCTPADLIASFEWERVSKDPWRLPDELDAIAGAG
jgi:glutamyl-tRNA synthetase